MFAAKVARRAFVSPAARSFSQLPQSAREYQLAYTKYKREIKQNRKEFAAEIQAQQAKDQAEIRTLEIERLEQKEKREAVKEALKLEREQNEPTGHAGSTKDMDSIMQKRKAVLQSQAEQRKTKASVALADLVSQSEQWITESNAEERIEEELFALPYDVDAPKENSREAKNK